MKPKEEVRNTKGNSRQEGTPLPLQRVVPGCCGCAGRGMAQSGRRERRFLLGGRWEFQARPLFSASPKRENDRRFLDPRAGEGWKQKPDSFAAVHTQRHSSHIQPPKKLPGAPGREQAGVPGRPSLATPRGTGEVTERLGGKNYYSQDILKLRPQGSIRLLQQP